ncbi:MAG TPA: PIG-L family deacetylase [Candidatus Limnocylindrales bacterium]|jgi:LmbE family N-acetylglucosaminyl deacetylase|nr:PIG-L family deacetylase [Candidatus Limnocylindrales bacterium]
MAHRLTIMTVHAHPDDETITVGGTLAHYAAHGERVICVTSTYGEEGEIVVPEIDTPENHARLGEIRQGEMAAALLALSPEGRIEHRWLGYRDSGMMGRPENDDPRALWQSDPAEAAGRLVRLVRELQPDVMVGENDFGGYGHPDHIRAALACKAAFEAAGDPAAYPEQLAEGLEPWRPTKLYESVFDMSRSDDLAAELKAKGIPSWWEPPADETPEQKAEREAHWAKMAAAAGPVTTRLEVSGFISNKIGSLLAHHTQIRTDDMFLALGEEAWRRIQPSEAFTLKVSRQGEVRIPETDLFAGLR